MKTIVWDIDDVLNDLMLCWFEYFCNTRQYNNINYQDLKENPPYKILNISINEYLSSLDEFRISDNGRNMTPVKEVLAWFDEHGTKFRHVALTSRPQKTIHVLADWLFRNYGNWIRTMSFIPAERDGENPAIYDRSKAGHMEWLGKVDLFVDDSEENISEAEKAGINTLLFPRPWNSSPLNVKQLLEQISSL